MRHVFDDLGYRRFEWKCDSLNEPSRARPRPGSGFTYEGRFRNAMVYQGPQPRHRLVLDHRRRVAARPRRARGLAGPGELRRDRRAAAAALSTAARAGYRVGMSVAESADDS